MFFNHSPIYRFLKKNLFYLFTQEKVKELISLKKKNLVKSHPRLLKHRLKIAAIWIKRRLLSAERLNIKERVTLRARVGYQLVYWRWIISPWLKNPPSVRYNYFKKKTIRVSKKERFATCYFYVQCLISFAFSISHRFLIKSESVAIYCIFFLAQAHLLHIRSRQLMT